MSKLFRPAYAIGEVYHLAPKGVTKCGLKGSKLMFVPFGTIKCSTARIACKKCLGGIKCQKHQ